MSSEPNTKPDDTGGGGAAAKAVVGLSDVEVNPEVSDETGDTAVDNPNSKDGSDSESDDEAVTNKVSDTADTAGCCLQCSADCLEGVNGEAAQSMTCCGNLLEMFGTIMEVIAAPVAGPCCMWWFHKIVVFLAMVFFIVNVATAFDQMSNSTVTEIALVHETTIVYPDVYICTPAFAYFHSYVCCKDDCGQTGSGSGCQSAGNLALPLQGNSSGCDMGVFSNFDMGKTAASSCPYRTYRGKGSLTAAATSSGLPTWANYPTFKMEFAGANPTWKGNDMYKNLIHTYAEGLENKLPSYTPSNSYQVTLPTPTGTKLVVGQKVKGSGTYQNTATVTGVNTAGTLIILSDVSCNGAAGCSEAILTGETMTTTTGTIFTTAAITATKNARGYRYRNTVFKPYCYYFANEGKANATYTGVQNYVSTAFAAEVTNNVMSTPVALEAYLMEQGKVPYAGTVASSTGGILATKVLLPAMGNVGIGQVSFDKIKDESKGESAWTYLFDLDSTSYPFHTQTVIGTYDGTTEKGWQETSVLNSPTAAPSTVSGSYVVDGPLISISTFTVTNFVVREITIRDYTFVEYWEAVGALWAGSLLILVILFGETDISDAKHRMYRVFNFTLPKYRDAWLEEAEANPDNNMAREAREAREERDAEFNENWDRKQQQQQPANETVDEPI
jgi:hypothetical protein